VPGYFVAHADLDDLAALGRGEAVAGDPGSWARAFALLDAMPQVVVAAVNGQAWGGGCELSLACTLRVAATSAHFGQPEVAVGIIPGAGGTQRLPRLVGAGRAAELILSARTIDAAEAHRIGLVEAVLPDEGFLDHVRAWVEPIATKPRHAVVAGKRAILDGLKGSHCSSSASSGPTPWRSRSTPRASSEHPIPRRSSSSAPPSRAGRERRPSVADHRG
jgi:enoyl-CoA hydratase/carnithine racemase